MDSKQGFTPILASLEAQRRSLKSQTSQEIYRNFSAYEGVPLDSLTLSVDSNLDWSLRALKRGYAPTAEEMDSAEEVTSLRFEQGVSFGEVILAFRVSIRRIHEAYVALGAQVLPRSLFANGSRILWQVGDAFLLRSATTFHELEISKAQRDAEERANSLRALLSGAFDEEDLERVGFNKAQRYAVVRMRGDGNASVLRRIIGASGGTDYVGDLAAERFPVLAEGDECVGVIPEAAEPLAECSLAIGSFVEIQRLCESDAISKKVMDVKDAFGIDSNLDVGAAGWRLAFLETKELASLYRPMFVEPVLSKTRNAIEVLETVSVWLKHSMNYAVSAKILHLHSNTVRYRVDKFMSLTGFQADHFESVFGALWAIQAELVERRDL